MPIILYPSKKGNANNLSPNFETFKEPKKQFQGINSARLCSLTGRYDNPFPTRFLAPIDCLKIPPLDVESHPQNIPYQVCLKDLPNPSRPTIYHS